MSKNLSFVFLLALISAIGINTLEAQSKAEKKVTIIKKMVDKDGNETIERIEASGDEADKYLKEVESMEGVGDHIDIDINVESAENGMSQKKIKMIVLDEDGKEKILEWDGKGDMPQEMQSMVEQHDIEINIEEELEPGNIESEDLNMKRTEIINKDGSKTVKVEVNAEQIKEGIEKSIEVRVDHTGKEQEEVIVEVIEENNNKAQLGVMIAAADGGVAIQGFAPESNAEAGGLQVDDIITNFNGTDVRTLEELVSTIGSYKAGDKVRVQFKRGGVNMEKEITLTPRTGVSKKKFKWKQAGKQ